MRWLWQQPDWPNFRYDQRALEARDFEFRLNSERLAGSFDVLPTASQKDATIDLMLSEAIKTSAIEGEALDRESVRSSLLSLITLDTLPDNSDQKAGEGGHKNHAHPGWPSGGAGEGRLVWMGREETVQTINGSLNRQGAENAKVNAKIEKWI